MVNSALTAEELGKDLKNLVIYPKQTQEHHALADAEWQAELAKFIDFIGKL